MYKNGLFLPIKEVVLNCSLLVLIDLSFNLENPTSAKSNKQNQETESKEGKEGKKHANTLKKKKKKFFRSKAQRVRFIWGTR